MTPDDVARESFAFWQPKVVLPVHTFALLGNEDGETGFKPYAVGDHGEAFGPGQWHLPRIEAMALPPPKGCGIDVRTASHLQQLEAWFWEMQHGAGYSHVWANLMATTDIESAVTVLVQQFEHSAMQARDILRRTAYAQKWQRYFGAQTATA